MNLVIGVLIGVFIGMFFMKLIQIDRVDALSIVYMFYSELQSEKIIAMKEHKSNEYIEGISRAETLYEDFFDEELKEYENKWRY